MEPIITLPPCHEPVWMRCGKSTDWACSSFLAESPHTDAHIHLHIWELPDAITNLLPLATEQFHWSNLGFLPGSRTTRQQLLREQWAIFIYFPNPNWQPFSHQPIPYPLGFPGLTSSFSATLHFTLTALCSHSAVTTYCGCWAAPLKQLGVNCYFQGHLNRSCSFRLQLCPTVPLT